MTMEESLVLEMEIYSCYGVEVAEDRICRGILQIAIGQSKPRSCKFRVF
ncbi:unnamed protein product [Coffea canephora]|uniref:Uncharacterized protein n=1 Tax=Coffea canephora TaxID=49390 RepID=A0A068V4J2_COFCA|nr:unnamed protein product [Coffea canephora]